MGSADRRPGPPRASRRPTGPPGGGCDRLRRGGGARRSARDRDLVGLERDTLGVRIGPRLEVHLGAGEGDPAVADADRLDPPEPRAAGERGDPPGDRARRAARRLRSVPVGGVGRAGMDHGLVRVSRVLPPRGASGSPKTSSSGSGSTAPAASPAAAVSPAPGVTSGPLVERRPPASISLHDGRSAPSAAAIGSTVRGSFALWTSVDESGPRIVTDAIPVTRTITATVTRTAVVPATSEIGPTMMIGTKLATETSMFRMPKTRPRTSSGRSSCSWVWAGIATKAYAMPASSAIATTTASSEVTPDRSKATRRVGALETRLIGPADRARVPSSTPSSR